MDSTQASPRHQPSLINIVGAQAPSTPLRAGFRVSVVADEDRRGAVLYLCQQAVSESPKDLLYASEEARKHSLSLTTAQAAIAAMRKAIDAGMSDKDFSCVVEVIRQ